MMIYKTSRDPNITHQLDQRIVDQRDGQRDEQRDDHRLDQRDVQRVEQRDDHTIEARLEQSIGGGPIIYKELSHAVVGAAIEVHRRPGPGMLERTYQLALESELRFRRIAFAAQVPVGLVYRGDNVGEFIADLIVDQKIIVELEAVERYLAVHRAQVFSYLGATRLRLGLLINFNVPVLWQSVVRVVR
ncbi:hypothetical protein BH11MYX1_BH11MYX1_52620 [soil metagenome]